MTKIAITKIATSPKMILPNMHNSSVAEHTRCNR